MAAPLPSASARRSLVNGVQRLTVVVSSLAAGGAERTACELANGLAGRGLTVTVVTLDASTPDHFRLESPVTRVAVNIVWPRRNALEAAMSAARRLRIMRWAILATRPDVVLSLTDMTNVRVLLALLATHVPVVVSERSHPTRHAIGRRWDRLRRWIYPRAQCVVMQTSAAATWAHGFLREDRVAVVPNFTRVAPPAATPTRRRENIVLSVGRLGREKGHDLLIHAFARARLADEGWRLVIAGEGPERQPLRALSESLGVSAGVELIGTIDTVEAWLHRAALFVLPSRYEGFPNALLEAMAAGLPCVAFDCDFGPRELIIDGDNGVLVPPEDVDGLGEAIARLAADDALCRNLAMNAVRVLERFSRPVVLDQWVQVLQDAICAGAGRRRERPRGAVTP